MKKRLRDYKEQYLIRPIIYKTLIKACAGAILGWLWDHFCNTLNMYSALLMVSTGLLFIFGASAWFFYLRLDGVRLPRLRLKRKSGKPKQSTSDLTDHLDTDLIPDEELTDDERDFCSMISSLIVCIICLIIVVIASLNAYL